MSITSYRIREQGFFHPLADDAADEIDALEAENAALKEQVARLEAELADRDMRITALKVEWNKAYEIGVLAKHELTALQSKSAALVDALEALLSWVDAYAETSDAEFPDVEDKCNAALADFKGAK